MNERVKLATEEEDKPRRATFIVYFYMQQHDLHMTNMIECMTRHNILRPRITKFAKVQ